MAETHPLDFTAEICVPASPERVWAALVTPERVAKYHLAPLLKLEPRVGGEILYGTAEEVMLSGTITQITPNSVLAHTFRFGPPGNIGPGTDPDTLVIYALHEHDSGTALKLRHTGFTEENQTHANITSGWPHILKSLDSLLST